MRNMIAVTCVWITIMYRDKLAEGVMLVILDHRENKYVFRSLMGFVGGAIIDI